MDRHVLQPGARASIRTIAPDGFHDVIGWIEEVDDQGVLVEARDGIRCLSWADIVAARVVGVARGRDPRRVPTAILDEVMHQAGAAGRRFVIRLSALLDGHPPVPPDPTGVQVAGDWAIVTGDNLMATAWAAAKADARSLLVVTEDPLLIARLCDLGFSEVS